MKVCFLIVKNTKLIPSCVNVYLELCPFSVASNSSKKRTEKHWWWGFPQQGGMGRPSSYEAPCTGHIPNFISPCSSVWVDGKGYYTFRESLWCEKEKKKQLALNRDYAGR